MYAVKNEKVIYHYLILNNGVESILLGWTLQNYPYKVGAVTKKGQAIFET